MNEMGLKPFKFWIRDVFCTQPLRCWGVKHISNHAFWRFEKRERCYTLTTKRIRAGTGWALVGGGVAGGGGGGALCQVELWPTW